MNQMLKGTSLILNTVLLMMPMTLRAASYYPVRLDDPKAVYLTPENFPVRADGVADDADALQQAINKVQETVHQGVVFIPEGQYRLGKTVYVWSGIRLIGYGSRRPVFILGENTPGFQEATKTGPGIGTSMYMIHFVSDRPEEGKPMRDANPGTFYSGISNIDIEIRDGNPAAIGIRSHFAQHCSLAHMDFRIGSGEAGVEEAGNESEDLHFFGGEFGITMHKPSPSWPFLLIDSSFEGQRKAAIKTQEAGLTLVRNQFRNVPTAISINENRADELWLKDSHFENITGHAPPQRRERWHSQRSRFAGFGLAATKKHRPTAIKKKQTRRISLMRESDFATPQTGRLEGRCRNPDGDFRCLAGVSLKHGSIL